jgi:uncharacterized protein
LQSVFEKGYNMIALREFMLPVKGMRQEHYEFDFQIDKSFFSCFEDAVVADGDISVHLDLDNHPGFFELNFDFEGTVKTECDRCLAEIDLPVEGVAKLIVKYSEEEQEDNDEIVFIHPDTASFNVAPYVYEFISLALPFTRTYDCENDEEPPCDYELLGKISGSNDFAPGQNDEDSSLGSQLKDINLS